jgi:hypothetical protein
MNSVRTSKRTPHFTITKISGLTVFKEIITVYSENYTKLRNTKFSVSVVKAGGRYSYHSALKGYCLVYLRNEALNYSQEFQKKSQA